VEITHPKRRVVLVSMGEHELGMPNNIAPLAVRTHVRYHLASHQNFMFRPKPNALMATRDKYQSGWIKVQDWDDVTLAALVDGDIHVEFQSRGFVQV
jgi:hypothetical protein